MTREHEARARQAEGSACNPINAFNFYGRLTSEMRPCFVAVALDIIFLSNLFAGLPGEERIRLDRLGYVAGRFRFLQSSD